MPAKPTWMRRIPQIRSTLEAATSLPFLDRAGIEKLFHLRRRQALRLLQEVSSHQVGNALVAPRERVLAFVKAAQKDKLYRSEELRRQRVREAVDEARRDVAARSVKIPLSPTQASETRIASLPETIRLAKGELRITFREAGDLLQQLFVLSRAIGRDFPAFEELLRQDSPAPADDAGQPGLGYQTGFTRRNQST